MSLRNILAEEGLLKRASDVPSQGVVLAELKKKFENKPLGKYYKMFVYEAKVLSDYGVDVIIGLRWKSSEDRYPRSTTSEDFRLASVVKEMLLDFVDDHDWAAGLGSREHRNGVSVVTFMDPKAIISESHRLGYSARIYTVAGLRNFPSLIKR